MIHVILLFYCVGIAASVFGLTYVGFQVVDKMTKMRQK